MLADPWQTGLSPRHLRVDFSAAILQNLEQGTISGRTSEALTTVAGIDPRFYYLTLGLLVLCTLVGAIVVYRFQREVEEDLSPPTERDLLGPLEKAFYSGLMRPEEFERIQESMARQKGDQSVPAGRSPKPRLKPTQSDEPETSPDVGGEPGQIVDPTEESPPPITPTGESGPGPSPD
jgi:hypothetical protein